MAKNIMAGTTICAQEMAHIFNNAEQRHIHLAEHIEAFARINKGEILRGRNNHRTGKLGTLR